MTLLAVERIKLFSTRSPWWCMALAIGLTVGLAALVAATLNSEIPMSVGLSQSFSQFGMIVLMVMAALAVTTEYRFSTIRATFLAVPGRTPALLAKTTVVALLAGVIGEVIAFGSWGISKLIKSDADLAINSAVEWRNVAGTGLVFLIAAVFAVAVGTLVRQTAGAVTIVLVYVLLVENLVELIPKAGRHIQEWMPFHNANNFLTADGAPLPDGEGPPRLDFPFGPWGSLAYFAAIALGLLVVALVVAKKRDA